MLSGQFLFAQMTSKKFANMPIAIDGNRFVNCQFERCSLLYNGGPVEMENCMFDNCEWKMQGTAAIVAQSLELCGWRILPPEPEKVQ